MINALLFCFMLVLVIALLCLSIAALFALGCTLGSALARCYLHAKRSITERKPYRAFTVDAMFIDNNERFTFKLHGRDINIFNAEQSALAKLHQCFNVNNKWLQSKSINMEIHLKHAAHFNQYPAVKICRITEVPPT